MHLAERLPQIAQVLQQQDRCAGLHLSQDNLAELHRLAQILDDHKGMDRLLRPMGLPRVSHLSEFSARAEEHLDPPREPQQPLLSTQRQDRGISRADLRWVGLGEHGLADPREVQRAHKRTHFLVEQGAVQGGLELVGAGGLKCCEQARAHRRRTQRGPQHHLHELNKIYVPLCHPARARLRRPASGLPDPSLPAGQPDQSSLG